MEWARRADTVAKDPAEDYDLPVYNRLLVFAKEPS
jgi:hypothetical protein